jgi:hypothetical protein
MSLLGLSSTCLQAGLACVVSGGSRTQCVTCGGLLQVAASGGRQAALVKRPSGGMSRALPAGGSRASGGRQADHRMQVMSGFMCTHSIRCCRAGFMDVATLLTTPGISCLMQPVARVPPGLSHYSSYQDCNKN